MRSQLRMFFIFVVMLSMTLVWGSAEAAPVSHNGLSIASQHQSSDRQLRVEYYDLLRRLTAGEQLSAADKARFAELYEQLFPSESSRNPLDNQGGPDDFGYFYMDNVTPDTATYSWIELRGDANATWLAASAFSSTDDGMTNNTIPIGFSFPFYDGSYTSFRIGTNGDIQFTTDYPFEYWTCIPRPNSGPAILPLSTDLHLQNGGIPSGDNVVGYRDFGSYMVIEWDSVGYFSGACSGGSLKYEVILYNTGRIKMQYNHLVVPNGCQDSYPPNIGIQENGDQGTYLIYACGAAGIFPEDGRAIWWFQPDGIPAPPTNLAGAVNGTNVTLTWVDPTTDTNGNPITLDNLQVWLGPVGSGQLLATVNPGVQTYTHVGASNGFHTYNVRPYSNPFYGTPASVTVLVGDFPWHPTDYEWQDISQIGTVLPLGLDEYSGALQIGFEFTYYDQPITQLWVGSHGFITFNDPGFNFPPYVETPIPDPMDPNNAVYCFWDDNSSSDGGTIYYYSDPANGQFIVSWDGVTHFGTGEHYWFQLILNENGSIVMNYQTIPINNSCTIGVEDATGSTALQVCFDGGGDFLPADGTSLIFWEQASWFAPVSGHVSLDGGNGAITQVLVSASGPGHPTVNPAANGNYTIDSVAIGNRRIIGTLAGYIPDTMLVTVDSVGLSGIDLTLRRSNPPAPTNFVITALDTVNGILTFNWDDSPDPLVDYYNLYRKLRDDDNFQLLRSFTASQGTDTLPGPGIWRYAVTAVDEDVSTPAESDMTESPEVLFGELPPTHLIVNGNFDDHVHLSWLPPGVQQSIQIFYDDSTSEIWMRVTTPNMDHDYFAVRFTPPDTVDYPLPIQTCNVYMERSDPLPNVWLCPDNGIGEPDMNNPYMNWQNIGADGTPGWLIAHVDGEVMLEDNSDFWMVWQFPPGITGPGTGTDWDDPIDGRSYWTYDGTPGIWNQWFSGDWMARIWAGGEAGWGLVMSVGGPSGYSVDQVPAGTVAPNPEEIAKLRSRRSNSPGPVRIIPQETVTNPLTSSFATITPLREVLERPYSAAPALEYLQRPGRNSLDQELLYYIVRRDGNDIAHPTLNQYNDTIPENQPHDYYVTGFYDNGVESGPTSTVTGVANMAPGAPTNPDGVSLNNTDIRITWLDPTACANGQPLVDLASLRVYRDGSLIGSVAPGVQQYVDTPPQANRTYTWSIRGIDEVPNVGPAANWSGSVVLPWNECSYDWIDITGNGINTGLSWDDQTLGPFNIGFPFTYYGNTYNQVWICSNGWITFTSTTEIAYWNGPIPDPATPNNVLYLFWDDLYLPSGGQILYLSDVANGRFIVEFDHVPHIDGSGTYTMEAILDTAGGVSFQYNELTGNINSCTIGLENATGTDAIEAWLDGQPQGDWVLANESSVCFWGPEPSYANVTGTVTLDGGSGNVTNVLVQANGISHPQTNPAANGSYTLEGVVVGNRRLLASLNGYHTDTLLVTVPEGGYSGANMTLRRLNPPAPTNLTGSVNSGNGVVTLDWDNSPDPLVDGYNIYRKLSSDPNWTFDEYVTVSNDFDTLTVDGIWQYAVTAVDNDVTPPAVESSRSNVVTVLYGELPPANLTANGNFDDRIRLNWLSPGVHPSYQLMYDDSSAEAFYVVQFPNGDNDYFAVRFTPPSADTTAYPLPIQTVNLYEQTTDALPNVMVCVDAGGEPDMDNPIISWQDQASSEAPGWLTASAEGQVTLDSDADFWVVWQFPPGLSGTGTGSDANAPDSRSYWTGAWAWPTWQLWTAHDWMCRVWVGGQPGWGFVMSVGSASGYSVERVPMNQTLPTAEMRKMLSERHTDQPVGPVRSAKSAKAARGVSSKADFPIALSEHFGQPYSQAPALVYQQRPGRSTLDDILYYKVYRDGSFLSNDSIPPYDDIVGSANENVSHSYYVTAHYDNNQDSPPSNTVTGAANMAPAAPGNIDGNPVGSSQMQITWTDPTTNADGTNCVDLTHVRIYRSGTQVGEVGPGVQSYLDTPPEPDQFYTWTVAGVDEVPNVGPQSAGFTGAVQSPWQTCDYEWTEINSIGTNTGLSFDDQNLGPFNLGFDIEYYGTTYNQVYVCSNGWVSFTSTSTRYSNSCLPDPQEPNASLDLFFDDLYLPSGGQIYYYQDQANEQFIVEFDHVPHIAGIGIYTMEVIIGANGSITYVYNDMGDVSQSTVGVEDAGGTEASLEVWCNGAGPFQPASQTAVCFWGGPSGRLEGVVRAFGNNQPIEGVRVEAQEVPAFTFTDATGFYSLPLEPGTYSVCYTRQGNCDTCFANILIEDNNITVRNAVMRAPNANFSVSSISLATWPGHDISTTFNITNPAGQCPLEFTISDTSAWLTTNPSSGAVPANQSVTITVTASPAGFPPGTDHQSMLVIDHAALGSPAMIPVTMSISLSADEPGSIPTEYALYQNYPNPFNASTNLHFDLPQAGQVRISLFNVTGQKVATVVDGVYPAGSHHVVYTAADLPSGMYLVKLEAGSFTSMRKMLLLK